VYASQVGCEESEKFWQEINEVMEGIPENEDAVIGGDMNGHVGNERGEYAWKKNEAEEKVLDIASSYELAIFNTYFRKKKRTI